MKSLQSCDNEHSVVQGVKETDTLGCAHTERSEDYTRRARAGGSPGSTTMTPRSPCCTRGNRCLHRKERLSRRKHAARESPVRRYDNQFLRTWTNAPLLVRQDTGLFLREQMLWPDASLNRYVVWDEKHNMPFPIEGDRVLLFEQSATLRLRGDVDVIVAGKAPTRVVCTPALELLARAAAPYGPGHVEHITGVAPACLTAASKLMCAGRRIAITIGPASVSTAIPLKPNAPSLACMPFPAAMTSSAETVFVAARFTVPSMGWERFLQVSFRRLSGRTSVRSDRLLWGG